MSESPTVIVVAPPWLRTGTGRVIEAQIAYYRDRGYRTAFIAVAANPAHTRSDSIWKRTRDALGDLRADCVSIAALPRTPNPKTPIRHVRHFLRRTTALDWIVEIGALGELAEEIPCLAGQNPPTLIHVNHVYTLGFARRLHRSLTAARRRIPILVETHDIQSYVLHDTGQCNPWTEQPDSLDRLVKAEIALLTKASALIHLSPDDFEFFAARIPNRPHILAMPTIDPAFVTAVQEDAGAQPMKFDLLFVGTNHAANVLAIDWLFGQVWPLIADKGFTLKIVGQIDELVRERLPQTYETFRSCFVGPVADLVPYYRGARCVIAPMVSGRGISIKTIEAFALGKAFVGTSKAFRGMPMDVIHEAGYRPYDDPRAFADAILRTFRSESRAAAGRDVYDRLFSRQSYFNALDEAVDIARSPHE